MGGRQCKQPCGVQTGGKRTVGFAKAAESYPARIRTKNKTPRKGAQLPEGGPKSGPTSSPPSDSDVQSLPEDVLVIARRLAAMSEVERDALRRLLGG